MNQGNKVNGSFLYFKFARSSVGDLELSVIIMKHNLVPSPLMRDAQENDPRQFALAVNMGGSEFHDKCQFAKLRYYATLQRGLKKYTRLSIDVRIHTHAAEL